VCVDLQSSVQALLYFFLKNQRAPMPGMDMPAHMPGLVGGMLGMAGMSGYYMYMYICMHI